MPKILFTAERYFSKKLCQNNTDNRRYDMVRDKLSSFNICGCDDSTFAKVMLARIEIALSDVLMKIDSSEKRASVFVLKVILQKYVLF